MTQHRPHDLVQLTPGAVVTPEMPLWAHDALVGTRWVVVRRAAPPGPGVVSIGIRGTNRSQRFAATVAASSVGAVLTPEDLSRRRLHGRAHPARAAFEQIRGPLNRLELSWGPTGSVGYELAAGCPTVTSTSDLDLVIRATGSTDAHTLQTVHELSRGLPAPVDIHIETLAGAVTLSELCAGVHQVLVKTSSGPLLVAARDVLA